ncbi:MAG TPA: peptide ABC transporter substrate-binding protein [Azospirillaceae bacterium]|nr:peptide ABC transporter substrate-binding protein [Azospirillaceae bacterium]
MRFGRMLAGAALALCLGAAGASAQTVLHRGNGSEPETLDVHKSTGESDAFIQLDLFEGLLTIDAAGRLIPGVAERWEVSADGLTYTFHLRADATWSDGTPVTADDFAFSWRRLVDPATASRYAFFLWPVRNAEKVSRGALPPSAMGVEARGPRTFVVTLERPTATFLAGLQHHAAYPVSRANVEAFGGDYVKPGKLVSNGAFMLAEAVPQGHVKLVRNPHYHGAVDVKLDAVMYYPTENRDTELKRFRSGELHMTYDIPINQVAWLKANMADELKVSPFLSTFYFAFNMTKEPWRSNPKLRRALSLAVDRQAIAAKVTGVGELPAFSLVPPGTEGYDYAAAQPEWASWDQPRRDAEARRLLAEAGYGPGAKPLELEILYNTNENYKKVAIATASMWQSKLGAKVTLTNLEWKVFLATRGRKAYKDVIRVGWIGDYNDAYTFVGLFRSDLGEQNHSGFADAAVDDLLRRSEAEQDPERRRRLMTEAELRVLDAAPVVPVYHYVSHTMVSRKVRGWQPNLVNQHPSRFLSLAE